MKRRGLHLESLEQRQLLSISYWDGGSPTSNLWGDRFNWSGDQVPAAGADLVFSGTARTTSENDLSATFQSLAFHSSNFSIGGNAVRLSGNLSTNSGVAGTSIAAGVSFSDTAAVNLGYGSHLAIGGTVVDTVSLALNIPSGSSLTLGGGVSGSGSISFGLGNGSNVMVSGGISGSSSVAMTVPSGSHLTVDGGIANIGSLTATEGSGASLAISGGISGSGNLSFHEDAGAILTIGGGIAGSGSLGLTQGSGATATISGAVSDVSGITWNAGSGAVALLSGDVSGTGGLTKTGPGTLRLSGHNAFTGTTTIASGVFKLESSDALAGSTVAYAANGGTLDVGTLSSVVLGGLSGDKSLSLTNTSGQAVALSVGGNNFDATYSGVLSGLGSFTKTGTGTLTLSGSTGNTYGGGTTLAGGNVNLAKTVGYAIPGDLELTGNQEFFVSLLEDNQISPSARLTWTGTDWWQEIKLLGHDLTVAGIVDATGRGVIENSWDDVGCGSAVLRVNNSADCTFRGVIRDTYLGEGALSLIKEGTGKLTLVGDSVYHTGGTSVTRGVLQMGDGETAGSLGSGAVNIAADATVAFDQAYGQWIGNNFSGSGRVEFHGPGGTAAGWFGEYALGGDNSAFSGRITIDDSRLRDGTGPENFGAAAIGVLPGGQLLAMAAGATYSNAIALSGSGWIEYPGVSYGALRLDGVTWAGEITLAADAVITSGVGGESFVTGQIGGNFTLELGGYGTLTLGGAVGNTYTGLTTITGGNVNLAKTAGYAIPGDLELGGAASYFVSLLADEQIAPAAKLNWTSTDGYQELRLLGHSLTVGRIEDTTGRGVIENTWDETGYAAAVLTVDNAEDCTFNGWLRDQAFDGDTRLSVVKTGAGELTLAGENILFTGDLEIAGGAVRPGDGNALAKVTLDWNNYGGTLAVGDLEDVALGGLKGAQDFVLENDLGEPLRLTVGGNGSDTTYAGVFCGAGSLVKTGTGTLTLSGANSFAGGTTINGGVLRLGDGVTSNGSVAGDIANDAKLVFANPGNVTYSGVVSGKGDVVKTGAGVLTLTGMNSYGGATMVEAGTVQVGDGGANGSLGTGPVIDNSFLVYTVSVPAAAMVLGSGHVTLVGEGLFTLNTPGAPAVSIHDLGHTIVPGGAVSVTASAVMVGMPLTLTAAVADLYGECQGVAFYRDSNQNGLLDANDTLLASGVNDGYGYWSATVSTTGWGPTTDGVFAQAAYPANSLHPPAAMVAMTNLQVTGDSAVLGSALHNAAYEEFGGGFSTVYDAAAYGGRYRRMPGSETYVTYTFSGLVPGNYEVWTNYAARGGQPQGVSLQIFDGDAASGIVQQAFELDQTSWSHWSNWSVDGYAWSWSDDYFYSNQGTITVRVAANGTDTAVPAIWLMKAADSRPSSSLPGTAAGEVSRDAVNYNTGGIDQSSCTGSFEGAVYDNTRATENNTFGFGRIANRPYLSGIGMYVNFTATKGEQTINEHWLEPIRTYSPLFGTKATLVDNGLAAGTLTVTEADGTVYIFNRPIDQDVIGYHNPTYATGTWMKTITPGGEVTEVTSWTNFGIPGHRREPVDIEHTYIAPGMTTGTTYQKEVYAYNEAAGLCNSVTYYSWDASANGGAGGLVAYRRDTYTYYTTVGDNGGPGDLKSVTTQYSSDDGATWTGDATSYYRYYINDAGGIGFAHGLRLELSPEDYDRAKAFFSGADLDTKSDGDLMQFAAHYYEYYSSGINVRRVHLEKVYGERETTYDYVEGSGTKDNASLWVRKTIEQRPDGSTYTIFTNYLGETLLSDLVDGTGNRTIYQNKYNNNGQLELAAPASAINLAANPVYTANTNGTLTVNYTADGLFQVNAYYAADTAPIYTQTSPPPTGMEGFGGGVAGFLQASGVKEGITGTPTWETSVDYMGYKAQGIDRHPDGITTYYAFNTSVCPAGYQTVTPPTPAGMSAYPLEKKRYTFYADNGQEHGPAIKAVKTSATSTYVDYYGPYGQQTFLLTSYGGVTRYTNDAVTGLLSWKDWGTTSAEAIQWWWNWDVYSPTPNTRIDYGYDRSGQREWSRNAAGTIWWDVLDRRGNVLSTWTGTDCVPDVNYDAVGATPDWRDLEFWFREHPDVVEGPAGVDLRCLFQYDYDADGRKTVMLDDTQSAHFGGLWETMTPGRAVSITASVGEIVRHEEGWWDWYWTAEAAQVDQNVQVTVTDGLRTVSTSFWVVSQNVPPSVSLIGPSTGEEGSPIGLTASATDPSAADTAAGFTYEWQVTKDGAEYDLGTGADYSFTPADDGTYVVRVTAEDRDLGVSLPAIRVIEVANLGPAVTFDGPSEAQPGETKHYTFTTSDPGVLDTFSLVSIGAGAGNTVSNQAFDGNTGAGSFDVTFGHASDTAAVSVQVQDSDGATGESSLSVVVASPVRIYGETSVMQGAPYTLFLLSDLLTDPIESWSIDWGDGSDPDGDTVVGQIVQGARGSVTHAYAESNVQYTITATATNAVRTYSAIDFAVLVTPIPLPVNSLQAVLVSATAIDLAWTTDAVGYTGFVVKQSDDGGITWVSTWSASASEFNKRIEGTFSADATYVFEVDATFATGDPSAVGTIILPGRPTVTVVSESQIDISWNAFSEEADYLLERSDDGGFSWTEIFSAPFDIAFSDTDVFEGTSYLYRLAVQCGGYTSPFSAPVAAVTPPAAPSGLSRTFVSLSAIDLAWSNNSQSAHHFKIEQNADGGEWTEIGTTATGEFAFTAPGPFAAGVVYGFRVSTVDAVGTTSSTCEPVYVTAAAAITQPTAMTATSPEPGRIDLSWVDDALDWSGFTIERKAAGQSSWERIGTVMEKTYIDYVFADGQTYTYRVFATGTSGSASLASEAATVHVMPVAPSGLTATVLSGSQIELRWTDDAVGRSGYTIAYSTDPANLSSTVTAAADAASYLLPGTFTAGQTYYFKIRSNGAVVSPDSSVIAVSTPAFPTISAASTGFQLDIVLGEFDLSWTDPTGGNAEYQVERCTKADPAESDWTVLATLPAGAPDNLYSYADTSLVLGTTYFYRLTAVNSEGNSAYATPDVYINGTLNPNSGQGGTVISGGGYFGGGIGGNMGDGEEGIRTQIPIMKPTDLVAYGPCNRMIFRWNNHSPYIQKTEIQWKAVTVPEWGSSAYVNSNSEEYYLDHKFLPGTYSFQIRSLVFINDQQTTWTDWVYTSFTVAKFAPSTLKEDSTPTRIGHTQVSPLTLFNLIEDYPATNWQNIQISTFSQPAHGMVTLDGTVLTYHSDSSYYWGPDSFTYSLTDGSDISETGIVTFLLQDATPLPGPGSSVLSFYPTSFPEVKITGILNAGLSHITIADQPQYGNLGFTDHEYYTIFTLTYPVTLGATVHVPNSSFTYTISNEGIESNLASVIATGFTAHYEFSVGQWTVTDWEANDAPYSLPTRLVTCSGGRMIHEALVNTTTTLSFNTFVENVQHGELTINGDLTYTYIPDENYAGMDRFTFTVRDQNDVVSSYGTILLVVHPTTDPSLKIADYQRGYMPPVMSPAYVPGFARDFHIDPHTSIPVADSSEHLSHGIFFEITLPSNFHPQYGTVQLTYNASDPAQIIRNGTGSTDDPYTYQLPADGGALRLWATSASGLMYFAPGTYNTNQLPHDFCFPYKMYLYIECVRPTKNELERKISVTIDPDGTGKRCKDKEAYLNGNPVSLDIDATNTSTILPETDPSHAYGEAFEQYSHTIQHSSFPSYSAISNKIIVVNDGDTDRNGVPDYADGVSGNSWSGKVKAKFVPLVVEVPDNIDMNTAQLMFAYSGSDPNQVTGSLESGFRPAPGDLRLWRKDGNQHRSDTTISTTGDYITPNCPFLASKLTWQIAPSRSNKYAVVYIEAVSRNLLWGSVEINFMLDPHGNNSFNRILGTTNSARLSDYVRLSIISDFAPDYSRTASVIGVAGEANGGNLMSQTYSGAVRLSDGTVHLSQQDLASSAYGQSWGLTRFWSNALIPGLNPSYGVNATIAELPQLIQATNAMIAVIGDQMFVFDQVDINTYEERFYGRDRLTYDLAGHQYVLVDTLGTQIYFNDFSFENPDNPSVLMFKRGGFKGRTNANGITTTVTNWDVLGNITSLTHGNESITFRYETPAPLWGNWGSAVVGYPELLSEVSVTRDHTIVRKVLYEYNLGSDAYSSSTTATLRLALSYEDAGTGAGLQCVGGNYYSYIYTNGFYSGPNIKIFVTGNDFARLASDSEVTIDNLQNPHIDNSVEETRPESDIYQILKNADLTNYYSYYLTYYSYSKPFDWYWEFSKASKVKTQTIEGTGSSSLTSLNATGLFQYSYNVAEDLRVGMNSWQKRTTVTLPDNNTQATYFNYAGEPMLVSSKVVSDSVNSSLVGKEWNTFFVYDNQGRLIGKANPSTQIVKADPSKPDLLNRQGGLYTLMSAGQGLIEGYEYYNGTETPPGPVGYLKDTYIKHGQTGWAMLQSYFTYYTVSAGGVTIHPVASATVYPEESAYVDDPTGRTTTYDYDFAGLHLRQVTEILPDVPAEENGTPNPGTIVTDFDSRGRVACITDADGFSKYFEYEDATGAVVFEVIETGLKPIITETVVDALGRPIMIRTGDAIPTFIGYKDGLFETWVQTLNADGPGTRTIVRNDRVNGRIETRKTVANGTVQLVSMTELDYAGRPVASHQYAGNGVKYDTEYAYDNRGRLYWEKNANGTLTVTGYDALGRPTTIYIGTTFGNLVLTQSNEYDKNAVGDGNLTSQTSYPGGGAPQRVSKLYYDWRDYLVAQDNGVQVTYNYRNNLGEIYETDVYDSALAGTNIVTPADGIPRPPSNPNALRAGTVMCYDQRGQLYRTQVYSVDPVNGDWDPGVYLQTDYWHDGRGHVTVARQPGGLVSETLYDGAGQVIFQSTGNGTTALTSVTTTYDGNGNPIFVVQMQRDSDGVPRESYVANYFDFSNRLTYSVDYGTNYVPRPSTPPTTSTASRHVTHNTYNAAGLLASTTSASGNMKATYEYDFLGRVVWQSEEDLTPGSGLHKNTHYVYDGLGHVRQVASHNTMPSGNCPLSVTRYFYETTTTEDQQKRKSAINSKDLLSQIEYPDGTTERFLYNALGEIVQKKDRNSVWHDYRYDSLGRLVKDSVSALPDAVDKRVLSLQTQYDVLGNVILAESRGYVGGVLTPLNQVKRKYNGFGQLVKEYQAHSGTVNESATPAVEYEYEYSLAKNYSRVTDITYPDNSVYTYAYNTGLDDSISRISSVSDCSVTIESYEYLGLTNVQKRTLNDVNISETTTLDAFGRVQNVTWNQGSSALVEIGYGYDTDGNLIWRDDVAARRAVKNSFGEAYTYNGLNHQTSFARGMLNAGGTISNATVESSWEVDSQGKRYGGIYGDAYNAAGQPRGTSSLYNGMGYATHVEYDAENSVGMKYDAWGRLVETYGHNLPEMLQDGYGEGYSYDALGRCITASRFRSTTGVNTVERFYDGNQVVLERVPTTQTFVASYVWSPADGRLICRSADAKALLTIQLVNDPTHLLDATPTPAGIQRLYALAEATGSVVAIVNMQGDLQERYVYGENGQPKALDADWTARVFNGINVENTFSLYAWDFLAYGERFHITSFNFSDETFGLYVDARGQFQDPIHGRSLQPDLSAYGRSIDPYKHSGWYERNASTIIAGSAMGIGAGVSFLTGGLGLVASGALGGLAGGLTGGFSSGYAANHSGWQLAGDTAIGGIAGAAGGAAGGAVFAVTGGAVTFSSVVAAGYIGGAMGGLIEGGYYGYMQTGTLGGTLAGGFQGAIVGGGFGAVGGAVFYGGYRGIGLASNAALSATKSSVAWLAQVSYAAGFIDEAGVNLGLLGRYRWASVCYATTSGKGGSWSWARQMFWMDLAEAEAAIPSGWFSKRNLIEMSEGRAAKIRVQMRNRNNPQDIVTRDIALELHHRTLPQRLGSGVQNQSWNLEIVNRWAHEAMDNYRHAGWDLVKILNGPNSW